MAYVDLNRTFVPVNRNDPLSGEGLAALARRYQSIAWPELLEHRRVIILAEAGSGKTEEFRERATALREDHKDAFFAAIEQLAELGLARTLGTAKADLFETWRRSSRPGWLFLDSVDEAKLQRHSFTAALAKVAEALGDAAGRARIFISCRGTDWDPVADFEVVQDQLPPIAEAASFAAPDPDEVLLSVLDEPKAKPATTARPEILVFSLTNLTSSQQRAFLVDRKVDDIEAFEQAITLRGLGPLAERPGDLDMLVNAWKSTGTFGTLREMVETHVTDRLRERDKRADANVLTDIEARHAAERVAAAMSLGKLLTTRAPSDEAPAEDAVSPADVLPDLTAQQRAALLRRGIFAPATYGRIRFHHRSALEYLTASWFRRLQSEGRLSEGTILKVFRRTACGITTVPPSLRPAAAWLAADCHGLLTLLQTHDPLTLIAFGDPSGLPISVRADLLRSYATKHAAAEVSHEFLDQHALWMFADVRLADAIRDAWTLNSKSDFRFELLRLIEVGKISACIDLLTAEALDMDAPRYNRIVAARAMAAVDDTAGLKKLAAQMLAKPGAFEPKLAPQLAMTLFPRILTVKQLLRLLDKAPPAKRFEVEGFGFVLADLYAACRTASERESLLGGVAKLCRQPPREDYEVLSRRHGVLGRRVGDLARQAVLKSDEDGVQPGLIALLQVVERTSLDTYGSEDPSLATLVRQRTAINQTLFWADVAEAFTEDPSDRDHPQIWRLSVGLQQQLWGLSATDAPWLENESLNRSDVAERRTALSAVYQLLPDSADLDGLAQRIAHDGVLAEDLAAYRAPREESALERKWRESRERTAREKAARIEADSATWRQLRDQFRANPTFLSDPTRLASWPGPLPLWQLTYWLHRHSGLETTKAPTEWHALKGAFGDEVAEAYANGMRQMWRVTPPERPKIDGDGRRIKNTIVLAIGGLNLESTEVQWLQQLDRLQASRVAEHLCQDDQSIPEWLDDLLQAWPAESVPGVLAEIVREWGIAEQAYTPFLNRAESSLTLGPALRSGLLALVDREPIWLRHVHSARTILRRAQLTPTERETYASLIDARLKRRRGSANWAWRKAYLALLFELDVATAARRLPEVVANEPKSRRRARAEEIVGDLFGMRGDAVVGLEDADIETLEALLRLSYQLVQPALDIERDGSFTPERRDEAQTGRNRVLTALINKGGQAAHDALIRMIADDLVGSRAHRFRQIAWEVAEREADAWSWRPRDVPQFEQTALTPVYTGEDLLGLACDAIDDISLRFQNGDYSSREVLETAQSEFAVQNWLAEQLEFRAHGRCTVAREKQVLNDNRPDIALAATAALVEVALELKHGDKGWTLPDLRHALSQQLAGDYLRVPKRRHGLFVVTNHRAARFWRDPESKAPMTFDEVMAILAADAAQIDRNSVQTIRVEVRGLNAAAPASPRRRSASTPDRATTKG